ncbi:hypothetical protein EDD21DRAFT_12982 [Dissophora ornata]|nr:hypothetical protein EDD21DRAFT_12982 [Dissophora ornata]
MDGEWSLKVQVYTACARAVAHRIKGGHTTRTRRDTCIALLCADTRGMGLCVVSRVSRWLAGTRLGVVRARERERERECVCVYVCVVCCVLCVLCVCLCRCLSLSLSSQVPPCTHSLDLSHTDCFVHLLAHGINGSHASLSLISLYLSSSSILIIPFSRQHRTTLQPTTRNSCHLDTPSPTCCHTPLFLFHSTRAQLRLGL